MKHFLKYGSLILLGVFIGLASLVYTLKQQNLGIDNGPWTTSLLAGGDSAGPYVRAKLAIEALLVMNSQQTVYFSATKDSQGEPLTSQCTYEISGADLPSRWWSVTIYGEDFFLVPNDQQRYSLTKNMLQKSGWDAASNNHWISSISSDQEAGLIAPKKGQFNLLLRLYNPQAEVYETPQSLVLPSINKTECAA